MSLLWFALPALAAAVINLVLFAYILWANPKSKTNRLWSMFLFSLFIISVSEFAGRMAGADFNAAADCHLVTALCSEFAVFFFLYFTLIYPKELEFIKRKRNRAAVCILLAIGILFIANEFIGRLSNPAVPINDWGFYSTSDMNRILAGSLYIPGLAQLGMMIMAGFFIILWRFRTENARNRRMLGIIIAGTAVFFALGLGTDALLPMLSVNMVSLTTIGMTAMGVIIAYAIARHKLFILEPGLENKLHDLRTPFEKGYYYIVIEDDVNDPKRSYKSFCDHVNSGIPGLIVTSHKPEDIRARYGLVKTPIIYMTHEKEPKVHAGLNTIVYIEPTMQPEFIEMVSEFLRKNEGAILLADCIGLIIRENSDTAEKRHLVLNTVRDLVKMVYSTNSRLLVSMDSSWQHTRNKMPVIKMENILRAGNLWPILVLEHLCNGLIRPARKRSGDIAKILVNLQKIDSFFNYFIFENGELLIKYDQKNPFTFHDAVHYVRLFSREARSLAAVDTDWIKKTLAEYGVNPHVYDFEEGHGYLVTLPENGRSLDIFLDLIREDYHGLFIGRTYPRAYEHVGDDIKSKATFFWLSDAEKRDGILPPRLEYLMREAEEFLEKNRYSANIILIDNIEYLVKYTDSFATVHLFLARLCDTVSERNGVLIVPIIRNLFSETEEALLLRELVGIDYSAKRAAAKSADESGAQETGSVVKKVLSFV